MGVATGLGIAFLMKRLEGQGVHQVGCVCLCLCECVCWSMYVLCPHFTLALIDKCSITCTHKCPPLLRPSQEVALVGLLSYLSYLLAEVVGLSGILSLFCCGIVVSHFVLPNM